MAVQQVYVETVVRAAMENVWRRTQDPGLHQRWDGRFGRITYVPETDPQELRYVTLGEAGTGVTVGERRRHDGGRTAMHPEPAPADVPTTIERRPVMNERASIFAMAMGESFGKLHPKVAERFSVGVGSGTACVATGTMSRIWHRSGVIRPFLHLGASRHVLVPEGGTNVPFTMENWPYLDRAGRETVTFNRTFELPTRRRRFDATMVYDEAAGTIVDYLGTHQHVVAPLEFSATGDGGLLIRGRELRLAVRRTDLKVPELVSGRAEVHESFDDRRGEFRIGVRVTNRWFGPLFAYEGTFGCDNIDVRHVRAPACGKPLVEVAR